MSAPVLLTPLRIEATAARLGVRGRTASRVETAGMGPERAARTAERLLRTLSPTDPVAVLGFAGGLDRTDRAGDLVVATELETLDGSLPPCQLDRPLAERVRERLSDVFSRVRLGGIVCSPALLGKGEMVAVAARQGSTPLACEMESAWLAPLAEGRPFVVVRALVDRPGRSLFGPWTVFAATKAFRRLVAAAGLVSDVLEQSY